MDINVKSPFFLTQALHGLLKGGGSADRPAKVINIGSIDGQRLNPWETYSYHASKAAILYLTKRLAARLVQDHILVTAIARSEEHTAELQSLMRISYAVFCLKKKKKKNI